MKAKDIIILALVVALIILLLKYCGPGGTTVESVKIDTVFVEVKQDTIYIPDIDTVYRPGKAPKALEKWDTLYVEGFTEVDTATILRDYHSFYMYSDTLKNKYGYVLVKDTISRNKILGRGVITDLLIPEVTKTITLIKPPRNQVYYGGGLFGSQKDALQGYEVNLSLKHKTDQIVELAWMQTFNGQGYAGIRYKRLLKLKK